MKVSDADIYRYMKRYLLATGFVPTYREISGVMGISISNVFYHMESLERHGYIERKGKTYRLLEAEIVFKEE